MPQDKQKSGKDDLSPDEVLRRMLNTPPKKKSGAKPKQKKKPAK